MKDLLDKAIKASLAAGVEIMKVYDQDDFDTEFKNDKSPLTKADKAASKVINQYLAETNYPIISEEIKNQEYSERKKWDFCWVVDPLDGTKEFIKKNGEFTVNIAFCQEGQPVMGVIYVPVTRELYYTIVDQGRSYKTLASSDHKINGEYFLDNDRIIPTPQNDELLRIVGSRSHMNTDTLDYIAELEGRYNEIEIVSKGSSLKFCLVAEGKADIYPRFAPTMEWDTAAGQAICAAVGLKVIRKDNSKDLTYNKEDLLNPHFVVSK